MSDNPTVCPYCGLPPKSTGGMQPNGRANACPAQDHTPAEMRHLLRDARSELAEAKNAECDAYIEGYEYAARNYNPQYNANWQAHNAYNRR